MRTKYIVQLLEFLAQKEGQSTDRYGFLKVSEAVCKHYAQKTGASPDNEIVSQRYLYDLYRKEKEKLKAGVEVSSPRTNLIDMLADYAGYPTFVQYEKAQEKSLSNVLAACIGNWWSYVRANAGEALFKAPVKIYMDAQRNRLMMEMRSKERLFVGEVSEESSCLTAQLESGSGKKLALVFKLGNSLAIEVLQGVFSGISSAGDPIAGRELLVREPNIPYDAMQWEQLPLNDSNSDARILHYFEDYGVNCMKIKGVSSFRMGDLL